MTFRNSELSGLLHGPHLLAPLSQVPLPLEWWQYDEDFYRPSHLAGPPDSKSINVKLKTLTFPNAFRFVYL